MPKSRIEAFTDAVIAIVMTLLVLELHEPKGDTFFAFEGTAHQFIIYLISFVSLAIYWNNHHHIFQLVHKVDGRVLWANNLLILTMTLFPYATVWVTDYPLSLAPQMMYGLVIFGADLSFCLLGISLTRANGKDSSVGLLFQDYKKMRATLVLNVLALIVGWLIHPLLILIVNSIMLTLWVVPEKKVEKIAK
ncbi:membrane protein [Enterococcus florum]|uniref:Membrane protein n=1 Tax=Enterococcus florum TaxID=2480627 RepID=A0A4P5PG12_9ENTE|nr:TMEM175 family protein [Enterococcus florum]GCF95361.1 membrane protein [Enterococcus florum]